MTTGGKYHWWRNFQSKERNCVLFTLLGCYMRPSFKPVLPFSVMRGNIKAKRKKITTLYQFRHYILLVATQNVLSDSPWDLPLPQMLVPITWNVLLSAHPPSLPSSMNTHCGDKETVYRQLGNIKLWAGYKYHNNQHYPTQLGTVTILSHHLFMVKELTIFSSHWVKPQYFLNCI